MDQILIFRNQCFENIFMVVDGENLYEGLSTKMFEIYGFKKLNVGSAIDEYDVLDSADRFLHTVSDEKEGIPTQCGKLSILDILLILKVDH